jgi:hypothetical protein
VIINGVVGCTVVVVVIVEVAAVAVVHQPSRANRHGPVPVIHPAAAGRVVLLRPAAEPFRLHRLPLTEAVLLLRRQERQKVPLVGGLVVRLPAPAAEPPVVLLQRQETISAVRRPVRDGNHERRSGVQ